MLTYAPCPRRAARHAAAACHDVAAMMIREYTATYRDVLRCFTTFRNVPRMFSRRFATCRLSPKLSVCQFGVLTGGGGCMYTGMVYRVRHLHKQKKGSTTVPACWFETTVTQYCNRNRSSTCHYRVHSSSECNLILTCRATPTCQVRRPTKRSVTHRNMLDVCS